MDSMEFNKIAGVVLAALLFIFGGSTLIHEVTASHDDHAKPAYQLADVEDGGDDHGGDAKKADKKEAFSFAQVVPLLKEASADAGKSKFKACAACHTANDGGPNRVGPNLWNIVSRDKASVDGFKYSGVLKEKGGKWTYEDLTLFLHAPKKWAPGTKMAYKGLTKPKDLANMLAYLQSLSASPVAFPEAAN